MYSRLAGMIPHGSLNSMHEVLGRSEAKWAEAGRSVTTRRIPVGLSAARNPIDIGLMQNSKWNRASAQVKP